MGIVSILYIHTNAYIHIGVLKINNKCYKKIINITCIALH